MTDIKKTVTKIGKNAWINTMLDFSHEPKISHYIGFRKACWIFGIDEEEWFLAHLCHESMFFKARSENLNYSEKALLRVFGKYFKTKVMARRYARNPEMIANRVYANRIGNGPEKSGDGWKYRGRGLIQTTGKANYMKLQEFFSDGTSEERSILENPDIINKPKFFCYPAAFYWARRKIDRCKTFTESTRKVNGGLNGFKSRCKILKVIQKNILKDVSK